MGVETPKMLKWLIPFEQVLTNVRKEHGRGFVFCVVCDGPKEIYGGKHGWRCPNCEGSP